MAKISKKELASFAILVENTRRGAPAKIAKRLAVLSGFLGGRQTDGIEAYLGVAAKESWQSLHMMGWQPVGQCFMRDYEATLGFCGANNFTAHMELIWKAFRRMSLDDVDLWVMVFKVEWLREILEKYKGGKFDDDEAPDSIRTSEAEGTGALQSSPDVAQAPSA
jgi:hypothetical protein